MIAFANGFINRWDEFADQETVSTKYNFKFVARQVEYENLVVLVSKSQKVQGLTLAKHKKYRDRVHELT